MWRSNIRQGIRVLARTPAVTIAAGLALALGIASNTLVFSVVDAVVFRPLPYADPAAIVMAAERSPRAAELSVSYLDYLDWRRDTTAFASLGTFNHETFNITGRGNPEQVFGANLSASMFDVLGVAPMLGRVLTEEDDRPSAPAVVVLTYASWARRFGADRAIVGQSITLDGVPRRIVGVMPRGFRFPITDASGEIFSPLGRIRDDFGGRGSRAGLAVFGRLKSGVSVEQARADLERVALVLARAYPDTNRDIRSRIDRYAARAVASSQPLLIALWGAVAAVLLVACASAASLLTARGAARAREFAIRLSLGATRRDVFVQLLTESLLLAAMSGLAGVLAAWVALPGVVRSLPASVPRAADIALDGGVLAFAVAATAATGLLAGLLPAWQAGRTSLHRTASARMEPLAANRRARGVLVVGQLALSQALLIGAGLLVATFAHLLAADAGFRPESLATALYYLPDAKYISHEQLAGFHEALLERVARLPGVAAAGLIAPPPFGAGSSSSDVTLEGRPESIKADSFLASPDALATLGVPLRAGRFFDRRDRRGSAPVAIVDEWFAARYLGASAIGQHVRVERSQPAEIVGVVGHIGIRALDYAGRPQIYVPLFSASQHFASIVARTRSADAMSAMPAIRNAVRDLDPELPLFNTASMSTLIDATAGSAQLAAVVFSAFAAAAWLLAAIGLSGVVAYSVTLRTRELGIRLALGAPPAALVGGIVAYGGGLTLIGLAIGLTAGVASARAISGLLVGVQPVNPLVIGATTLALLATGAVASYLPARRAARVDPLVALRAD
jgi:putative ABC transport system permease protein